MTRSFVAASLLLTASVFAVNPQTPSVQPIATDAPKQRPAERKVSRSLERQPVRATPRRSHRAVEPEQQPTAVEPSSRWDGVAECESGGDWQSSVGMFEGGLQFLPSTWLAYGGGEFAQHAYDATKAQQITVAERVLAAQGWNAWPICQREAA